MDSKRIFQIRILYYYLMMVAYLGIVYLFLYAFIDSYFFNHFIFFFIFCVPLAIVPALFVEKAGGNIGNFLMCSFKGPPVRYSEFSADLEKARHSKANGRYQEALDIINDVVEKSIDWPDALYLKAQILWEGFENATEAKRCLRRVMQLVKLEETLHRWASSLLDDIIAFEKEKYQILYE